MNLPQIQTIEHPTDQRVTSFGQYKEIKDGKETGELCYYIGLNEIEESSQTITAKMAILNDVEIKFFSLYELNRLSKLEWSSYNIFGFITATYYHNEVFDSVIESEMVDIKTSGSILINGIKEFNKEHGCFCYKFAKMILLPGSRIKVVPYRKIKKTRKKASK